MNGKVIVIVGETGVGKTTYVKNLISKSKREIIAYTRIREDLIFKKAKVFSNFVEFIEKSNQKNNSILFIDEAFTCLPNHLLVKPDKPENIHNQIADLLVNARKLNNLIFIVYHALRQVPTQWLLNYINWFIRFQTTDQIEVQCRRFSSFNNIVSSLENHTEIEKFSYDEIKIR